MVIQDEEDQNIEFKESWNSTELLKWVCGFANAKGGRMYIGVRDDGEVLGLTNSKKLMEDIPNAIYLMLSSVHSVCMMPKSIS